MPGAPWLFNQNDNTVGVSLALPARVLNVVGRSEATPYYIALVALTHQWYRNGVAIPGETGLTYLEVDADQGATITVSETATHLITGGSATVFSAPVVIESFVGASLGLPSKLLSKFGKSLVMASHVGAPVITLSYQWYRDGVAILGATGLTYTPVDADAGAVLTVEEIATNLGGGSLSVFSEGKGPIHARVFHATLGSKIFGNIQDGTLAFEVAADTKYANVFFAPNSRLPKLTVLCDGLGSGVGAQAIRGVLYNSTTGGLLAQTDEVVIQDGQPLAWVDLPFGGFPGGVPVVGNVEIGIQGAGNTHTARVWGRALLNATLTNSDTYSDGASSAFGSSSTLDVLMAIFATYVNDAVVPDETEFYYARLPFPAAQDVLDTGKVTGDGVRVVECGWHGTRTDPERGSFVLVNSDGPLADVVGERLLITAGRGSGQVRHVVAYCHAEATLAEDLSLPRRLFFQLAVPGDLPESVEVELVA